DQYLRVYGLGDRSETNPRAYDVRKRYQLMYMNFKPEFFFWLIVILLRKFGVAFAALMFRGNATFQLAVILVVIFTSFTLQVRYRPFLSAGEYAVVRSELLDKANRATEDDTLLHYSKLHAKVGESYNADVAFKAKDNMGRHKVGGAFWGDASSKLAEN